MRVILILIWQIQENGGPMPRTATPAQRGRPPSRAVADLVLAEQIVVWALRRYRAGAAGLEPLAGTFRRVFGLDGVERALAAFGQFIAALERHSRQREAPPADDGDPAEYRLRLSATEACVLRLLAAAQGDDPLTASAVATWLVRPAGQGRLLDGAIAFAASLARAGQSLPLDPVAPGLGAAESGTAGRRLLPAAAARRDLGEAERLVLTGLRLWVGRVRRGECGGGDLYRHLAGHGAAAATPGLHGLLYNLSVAAARPIDIRCPACPGLSPDEARLLRALAAAQSGGAGALQEILQDLLAPAAARLTAAPVRGAALALAEAGVDLPPRAWDLAALAATAEMPSAANADGDDCIAAALAERPHVLH
jgi:hypothetical protein